MQLMVWSSKLHTDRLYPAVLLCPHLVLWTIQSRCTSISSTRWISCYLLCMSYVPWSLAWGGAITRRLLCSTASRRRCSIAAIVIICIFLIHQTNKLCS
jgi:hypothetical protein